MDPRFSTRKRTPDEIRSGLLSFPCSLPKDFTFPGSPVYTGWMTSEFDSAEQVDKRIRELGWHFMWLALYCTRSGIGRTAEAAFDSAMHSGLHDLNKRFNTAELMDVTARKYLGIHIARVRLASRHIQEGASFGLLDGAAFRIRQDSVDAHSSSVPV